MVRHSLRARRVRHRAYNIYRRMGEESCGTKGPFRQVWRSKLPHSADLARQCQ